MTSLSIIIVSYRSWNRLDACLKSIAVQAMSDIEVIVVDNHSDDGQAQQFISMHPLVRFVLQDTNAGFSQACNRGAKEATGNWLLFLNPDTVLQPNTLAPLLDKVANEPTWKLIGIRQLNDQGKDTHPHGLFLKWWNVWAPVRSLERLLKGEKSGKQYLSTTPIAYPDWISGAFVLIRKTDFEILGGWDERFWMYFEDMDLSKRAAEKGWKRVLYNELVCTHSHGGSSRINPETKAITKSAVIISAIKYLKKHNRPLYFGLAMDMFVLSKLIDIMISYPFSATKRAMAKQLLAARLD
jgi:GT2 family glycosyltransferase